jgi:hypothetical protein
MTRIPKPKKFPMFTRQTQLESGEHQIDGYDIEGFPVRFCLVDTMPVIPGTHPFTDANGPEGNDQ